MPLRPIPAPGIVMPAPGVCIPMPGPKPCAGGVTGPAARAVPANSAARAPAKTAIKMNRFIVFPSVKSVCSLASFSTVPADLTPRYLKVVKVL